MKKQTANIIAHVLAALIVGGTFAVFSIACACSVARLAPDRPGMVLLSGLVGGLLGTWLLGWIARPEAAKDLEEA